MNEVRPTRMEGRIRASCSLIVLGLLIEGVTLLRSTPISFMAFAILGIGFVLLGIFLFLISLVTVRD